MAEQLMETMVRAALWQQFSAAIAMLACPETLWASVPRDSCQSI